MAPDDGSQGQARVSTSIPHTEMRCVLHLTTETGWRGGENQALLLARGLTVSGSGWRPVLVAPPDSPLAREGEAAGLSTVPLTLRGGWQPGAIRALRNLMRTQRVDVVHAHTSHAHSVASLACLGTHVPLVVTRRVDFPVKRGPIAWWKYRHAVTHFAAVSQAVAHVLRSGGVSPERITVIHDGIDFGRFPPVTSAVRTEFALPHDALVVGVTAQLTDHKDHRTLLRAWGLVEAAAPDAWLLIIGTGELEATLKRYAASRGLKRVVFTGFRTDVNQLLRGMDLFTLTSHLEGLGSSVMDAMYCGLPVVATRAGGLPELVHDGETGVLVPVGDHAAVAEALVHLLRDTERRRRYGARARQHAIDTFSAARMVRRYVDLYDATRGALPSPPPACPSSTASHAS
jgi:glycosyltransferase involved in cell wall biosynthesis